MKKIYYDDYIDNEDEISDEEMMQDLDPENHGIILDDPDTLEYDEDLDDIQIPVQPKTLLSALRDELKLQEPDRGALAFSKDGVDYEGVPMLEINPNKFVFKLEPNGKMQSIVLSDIQVLA
jgi:hypothetical protein